MISLTQPLCIAQYNLNLMLLPALKLMKNKRKVKAKGKNTKEVKYKSKIRKSENKLRKRNNNMIKGAVKNQFPPAPS